MIWTDSNNTRHAAETLAAYLDVFTTHYLSAKRNLRLDRDSTAHQRLAGLAGRTPAVPAVPTLATEEPA